MVIENRLPNFLQMMGSASNISLGFRHQWNRPQDPPCNVKKSSLLQNRTQLSYVSLVQCSSTYVLWHVEFARYWDWWHFATACLTYFPFSWMLYVEVIIVMQRSTFVQMEQPYDNWNQGISFINSVLLIKHSYLTIVPTAFCGPFY